MIEIRKKLKVSRAAYQVATKGELKLPFELRQKTRLHTRLASGEEVGLMLPRGEVLRGGDLLMTGTIANIESRGGSMRWSIRENNYLAGPRVLPILIPI